MTENTCPVCGSYEIAVMTDGDVIHWQCPVCGFAGGTA